MSWLERKKKPAYSTVAGTVEDVTNRIGKQVRAAWKPPANMTVSEWSDAYRMLPPEASSQPGKWRTSKVPWMREIMDAYKDDRIDRIVMKFSAQMAKTEGILNMIGYTMDMAPEPMLLMLPTGGLAKTWIKDRLDPTIRDTLPLREKVRNQEKDKFAGNSKETLVHKNFPGGHFTAIGGNSTAETSMRPVGKIFVDEIDRIPLSIGKNGQVEGDPFLLVEKRGNTFWNRKSVVAATPTVLGISRVDELWLESTMERFFLPCPHCGALQVLEFKNLTWPENKPQDAKYQCAHCPEMIEDRHKTEMMESGVWLAEHPERITCRGFHMNEMYSPWRSFGQIAQAFISAKRGGLEKLRVFVNTVLGECWDEKREKTVDVEGIQDRGENYGAEVPMEACVITAGVDVQPDRLEVLFMAHGVGQERWVLALPDDQGRPIAPVQLWGAPQQPDVWRELDKLLQRQWTHASGRKLPLSCALVDSGDGNTSTFVYKYTKARQKYRVFSSKGSSNPTAPLSTTPTQSNEHRATLYSIGTNAAKSILDDSIRMVPIPGPSYTHFPAGLSEEFYRQLRAEKATIKYRSGVKYVVWEKVRERNEVLDCAVLNIAAFSILDVKDIATMLAELKSGLKKRGK